MPRYEKGSIQLSERQDIPLLRQVFYCAYVTREQLFEFMRLQGRERSPGALKMRLARLVKNDLIRRFAAVPGTSQSLYAISEAGLCLLVNRGVAYAGRGCGVDRPLATAEHALQLNEVHLGLMRSEGLREWIPETEICSRNILAARGYAKDYDAVVSIAADKQTLVTFALEYERSQKTDAEYQAIAITLNREEYVDFVLYVTTTTHLFAKVSSTFRKCRQPIAVCLAADLHARVLDANIVLLNEQWRMTLRELIDLKRKLKTDPPMRMAAQP
jgi:hypothetical protein